MFALIKRTVILAAIVATTSGFLGGWTSKQPKAWDVWELDNPQNITPVNHAKWDALLKKYIRKDSQGLNRFGYAQVTAADKKALKSYIKALGEIDITDRSRNVQLAYWLNLYNAVTIDVVLENYPVKTIRDIDISGVLSNGPWDAEVVTVDGFELTLNNVEHDILRPIWKDPRIHYGVNCASVGCPNLQNTAFTAANVDQLLDKGAREYINSDRGLLILDGEVTVSKIYKWFAYDFGNSQKGVINHLVKYANPETAKQLKKIGKISDTVYDWSLNGQVPPAG
ncbi:MAG: DUF547 domain-containing protein [Rhizobiaceae bacterium]|nr:DUF547 domain-containing protein [Rhizobiaceae bacterium]